MKLAECNACELLPPDALIDEREDVALTAAGVEAAGLVAFELTTPSILVPVAVVAVVAAAPSCAVATVLRRDGASTGENQPQNPSACARANSRCQASV
jgi:hypothetical protein